MFQPISERDSLCQGDVLRIIEGNHISHYGMIVTADCDIAQSKFGNALTYLPIVPVLEYIRDVWAPDKIANLKSKASKAACDIIWKVEKERDPKVDRISERELSQWLERDGVHGVINCFPLSQAARGELEKKLECISIETVDNIQALFGVWGAMGISASDRGSQLKGAIVNPRSDCFFIPTLPDHEEVGFMVLMREVQSIDARNVFRSHLEEVASDSPEFRAIRVGRFIDNVKYGIVQRFGSLFSRIGFEQSFEDECNLCAELALINFNERHSENV